MFFYLQKEIYKTLQTSNRSDFFFNITNIFRYFYAVKWFKYLFGFRTSNMQLGVSIYHYKSLLFSY